MSRNIKLLFLYKFFSSFRFYTPFIIIYFSQVVGSYALGMSLLGAALIFQALLEVPTGIFSDLVGRKWTLIISSLTLVITIGLYNISNDYISLMIAMFIAGISAALSSGNDDALLYDSLKEVGREADYHHFYSKLGTFQLISFGISALLGGLLAAQFSFKTAILLSVISPFIGLVISFFIHNSPRAKTVNLNPYAHLKEAIYLFIHNPKLRLLTLSNAYSNAITESTFRFSPIFVNALWPIWAVGLVISGNNFLNAFSYFISGKIISKFKALNSLVSQFLISRVVLIVAYTFPTFISPVLMVLTSLFYGVGQVSQKTLLQKEFSDQQRATMGSLDALLGSIAFAIASFLIGLFADLLGPRNILLIGEIILLPVLLIYWRLFLHNKVQK
jgi:MFS family permease